MLNKAVEEHHMTEWYNEVEDKTSLKTKVPHTAKTPNQKLTGSGTQYLTTHEPS